MGRIISAFFMVSLLVAGYNANAQQKTKGAAVKANAANAKASRLVLPQAYLGNTDYKGGTIKRDELNKLLRQRLTSRDSLGNKYQVTGFEFGYAERMLYEDSVSNVMVMVDYMTEYCPGDTLSAGISSSIYERLKPGDTVYIDRVNVLKYSPNSTSGTVGDIIAGKGMKFVITK